MQHLCDNHPGTESLEDMQARRGLRTSIIYSYAIYSGCVETLLIKICFIVSSSDELRQYSVKLGLIDLLVY